MLALASASGSQPCLHVTYVGRTKLLVKDAIDGGTPRLPPASTARPIRRRVRTPRNATAIGMLAHPPVSCARSTRAAATTLSAAGSGTASPTPARIAVETADNALYGNASLPLLLTPPPPQLEGLAVQLMCGLQFGVQHLHGHHLLQRGVGWISLHHLQSGFNYMHNDRCWCLQRHVDRSKLR